MSISGFLFGRDALKKAAGEKLGNGKKATPSASLPIAEDAAELARKKIMQEAIRKRQKAPVTK